MDAASRQDYIRAAVSFLQNPKLVESSLQDKLKFLREKGLTDIEVDEALNLALVDRHKSQGGGWNFFIVLGLCLSGYKLYKAYMDSKCENRAVPETVGKKSVHSKQEASDERISQSKISLSETDPESLSLILEEVRALKSKTDWCKNSLSNDIKALQTLLLGHEKLAAPPVIPAWQMESSKEGAKEYDGPTLNSSSTNQGDDPIESPSVKTNKSKKKNSN